MTTPRPKNREREIAEAVADYMFSNGAYQQGTTLRLHDQDGKYLGGWCKQAVVDAIESKLSAEKAPK